MSLKSGLTKLLLSAALLVALLWVPPAAHAQMQPQDGLPPPQKPVMENVFYNVVWGSATGAILGMSVAIIGSSDPSQPADTRQGVFNGATVGGLVGLGVGLYLVYQGISFNPASSQLQLGAAGSGADGVPLARHDTPSLLPFELITADSGPLRVTGFRANVLDIRF